MAKKLATPKQQTAGSSQQLIDAIATVKQLQDFISEHGSLDKAIAAAIRVHGLIEMTGGFEQLQQALEIVGKDTEPASA